MKHDAPFAGSDNSVYSRMDSYVTIELNSFSPQFYLRWHCFSIIISSLHNHVSAFSSKIIFSSQSTIDCIITWLNCLNYSFQVPRSYHGSSCHLKVFSFQWSTIVSFAHFSLYHAYVTCFRQRIKILSSNKIFAKHLSKLFRRSWLQLALKRHWTNAWYVVGTQVHSWYSNLSGPSKPCPAPFTVVAQQQQSPEILQKSRKRTHVFVFLHTPN